MTTYKIGESVEGKGIYLGRWMPSHPGVFLRKTFDVFAEPEDLTGADSRKMLLNYNETEREVAGLRNWHGHDGGNFANTTALYAALADGSYRGEWFIPPRDLMHGQDINGRLMQWDNLYALRNTGALKGTLVTRSGSNLAHCYWTSTELRDDTDRVYAVDFSNGDAKLVRKDQARLNRRLCRAELVL